MSSASSALTADLLPRSLARAFSRRSSELDAENSVVEHGCKNQKHTSKSASGNNKMVEEPAASGSITATTEQVDFFHEDNDVFDALKHYPLPLDPTPVKRSLLDILATIPSVPEADALCEARDGAQVKGQCGVLDNAITSQSLSKGEQEDGLQGDAASKFGSKWSSQGKRGSALTDSRGEVASQKDSSTIGSPGSSRSSQHAFRLDYLSEDGEEANQSGTSTSIGLPFSRAHKTDKEIHSTSVNSTHSEREGSSDVADMTALACNDGGEQVKEIECASKRVDETIVKISSAHELQILVEPRGIVPLRGIPVKSGVHLRYEEDGTAEESPGRRRTFLRGLPPPEGNHLSFED